MYFVFEFIQIGDITTAALSKAKDLNDFAEELYKRAKDISNKNTENEVNLEKAKKNADNANKLAKKATEVCGLQIVKLMGLTVNLLFQKYFSQLSCIAIIENLAILVF